LAGGFFFAGALGFAAGAVCGSERDSFDGRVSLERLPLPCDAGCRSLLELEVVECEVSEFDAAGLLSFFAGGVNERNPLEFADFVPVDIPDDAARVSAGVDGPRASLGDIAGA
jgi:hypothetical protein